VADNLTPRLRGDAPKNEKARRHAAAYSKSELLLPPISHSYFFCYNEIRLSPKN
jgi:hypothetical protein